MPHLNIGQAASAAGVTPKMVRHYEQLGLIPEVDRTDAGYRLYGEREVAMLRFIRQARGLGFSIKQIESLLALWRNDGRESREVKALALQQLQELQERQRELDQMRDTLSRLVNHCAGDHSSRCAILERLADTAATPGAPPQAAAPHKTLKQVRPGSQGAPRAKPARAKAATHETPAHSGLMAWSRSFGTSHAAHA